MDKLALKNILITFLQDNQKELSMALVHREKLNEFNNFDEVESLETEIKEREMMKANANKLLEEINE